MRPRWPAKYNAPILIHVAEMRKELMDSLAKNGATPVHTWSVSACWGRTRRRRMIWVDYTDMKISGGPSSGLRAQSIEQHDAGQRRGSRGGRTRRGNARRAWDGRSRGSNNDLDMMEEMDLAAKLQKTVRVDPRALGAKGALENGHD